MIDPARWDEIRLVVETLLAGSWLVMMGWWLGRLGRVYRRPERRA